jgi:RNA polymerase sigma-B factor
VFTPGSDLKTTPIETSSQSLLRAYHEHGDVRARERLITLHLPLVRSLARTFANTGEELDDLTQVGSVGLIKAIDRFDPSRGVQLAAFARPTVLGEIQRYLRDETPAVSAPRSLQEQSRALARLRSELSAKLGRTPTLHELASEAGTSEDSAAEALELERAQRPVPLDADGDGEAFGAVGVDEAFAASEDRLLLAACFRALPARERRILHLRYYAGLSQTAIAAAVGISQIHVSRLLAKALATLRDQLSGAQTGVSDIVVPLPNSYTEPDERGGGGSAGGENARAEALESAPRSTERTPASAHAA